MEEWLSRQLKRGNKKIDRSNYKCCCGKTTPKGYGYYCYKHNKQTPKKRNNKEK